LRAQSTTESIAIIHITATYYAARDHVKGLEGGADNYLVAPVEPEVLVATVRAAIRMRTIERELKQSQEQLAHALEAANMVAWEWDVMTDRIRYVGDTVDVLRRTYPEGAHAMDLWGDVHPDDREALQRSLAQAVETDESFTVQFRPAVDSREAPLWIEIHGRASVAATGGGKKISGVAMNITARKRVELQLEDEARRKEVFLSSLSHELRNPIAALRSATGLIRRRNPTGAELGLIMDNMDRQAKLLSRLVDDLLDISRLDHDRLSLRKQPVELATVLDMAMETSKPLIEERRHQLVSSVPTTGVLLYADPVRLAQVFNNILSNSAKYTPPGGRIDLTVRRVSAAVEISIKDNGIGIHAEELPRIFDLFYQATAAQSQDRVHDGLGIGLQLVKRLVELHDGSVVARSEGSTHGTEVLVILPIVDEDARVDLPPPSA
jgi:signal transduction histidine kinase